MFQVTVQIHPAAPVETLVVKNEELARRIIAVARKERLPLREAEALILAKAEREQRLGAK